MLEHLSKLVIAAALGVAIAACGSDSTAPIETVDEEFSDFSVGVQGDQAGLPGLMAGSRGDPKLGGCTFNAATGRIECPPVTHNGLTITRSLQLLDAGGVPQPQRGHNVVSINTRIGVTGTTTGRDDATFTVNRNSDLTVTGLGGNEQTHNGVEQGTITGTRTHPELGAINTSESFTHTTVNVVIPRPTIGLTDGGDRRVHPFPLSGTSARSVTLTRTVVSTGAVHTFSHSEVITFNGTAIVPVVVTRDGVTKNCTRNLATRMMTCE